MQQKKGQVSEEQLQEWKAKYKQVFEAIVDDAVCYLRKPTRQELSAATMLSNNDSILFNEQLLGHCWLGGAECIKTEDEYFLGVSPVLSQLIEVKHAELKKI